MGNFSRYFVQYLRDLFSNFGDLLGRIWDIITHIFYYDIKEYFDLLVSSWNAFNFVDWLFELLAIIVNVSFFGFLILRSLQFLRRYVRFTKREIEKDQLLEEIAILNMKTAELIDEKNKIMAMKVSSMGFGGLGVDNEPGGSLEKDKKKKATGPSRFSKLIAVDKKYETELAGVVMSPDDMLGLPELVDRFINFSAYQLH